jgi:hypothetical protein
MRWLSFLLLTGIMLQTCSKGLIITEYLVNREYISKVLCINKSIPEKHCDGKCHLKKQLEKDDTQQGDKQQSKAGTDTIFLVSGKLSVEWREANSLPFFFQYSEHLPVNVPDLIFHPPGIIISC